MIIAAGHGTVLREITRLLFEKKSKTRTLWLCGVANSGKSIFIRLLDLIFASDEVDWRGPYLPITRRNKDKIKTQILSSEEFNFGEAFSDKNLNVTKLLMEGRGASIRNDLYASFETVYEDAIVVVGSNKLPATEA